MKKIPLLLLVVAFTNLLSSCRKNDDNPVNQIQNPSEYKKTVVMLEGGLIDDKSPDWPIVSMLSTKAAITLVPDTSLYLAFSETSPNDTIVVISGGKVSAKIDSFGIPIADAFWGIRAYMRRGDSVDVNAYPYFDLQSYSIIDSLIFSAYKLIGASDTIPVTRSSFLYWKSGYRIDTLRFQVYLRPNLYLNYDRFFTGNLSYKIAAYDSTNRIAGFVVGIPTMSSEPTIVLYPFAKIDHVYENGFIKIISRFFYQRQWKLTTWQLP